jgi:DNA polymerase
MEDHAKAGTGAEWTTQIAGAFAWWREAGVDSEFTDEAIAWLASPTEPTAAPDRAAATLPPPPTAPATPAFDPSGWPQDLAGFAAWWLSEPALDDGRIAGRVPPRGARNAEIMVIVPDPERDDRDRLLSGPQGRLLDSMFAAMGIAPEMTYVASVLPRHTPMADWLALAEKGIGALLRHHVELVAPRRLVALGGNILPLLGNDPAHNPAVLRNFNQQGRSVPLLAGKSLSVLLDRPRWKAGLWQAWLDWSGGPESQE